MIFNVPQFIDVEDKIVGPLTAKQLGWLFALGGILLVLYGIFPKAIFFIIAIPLSMFFLALAFYRPYNQPLIGFLFSAILYLSRPKVYTWQRMQLDNPTKSKKPVVPKLSNEITNKELTLEKINDLSRFIDTGGKERNEKILEIIKQNVNKK